MKSISFSCAIALLAFAFSARAATVTYTPGTGVLLYPENFFEANSNSIVQAISGAFPGSGSGNASTNVAQGWSASQTFNALVSINGGWTPFTNNTRVVFEGDSLSTYIGNEGQTNWSKYLTNYFPSLNLTASANAATSGQQISQMLTDYAAQVQPYKPSGGTNAILFFWAGLNDVYYTNYTTALTRLTNYWAGAKADGFTLVGFTLTDSTFLTAQTRANLSVINNLIRQHAPLYCDYFVDVAELLNDVEDTNSSSAGVHYTSRANEILAEHVRWTLLQGGFFHRRITGTRNYPDNSFRSLSFVSNASPSAMVGGGLAFDADAHAAGRGALVLHDGTSNTVVVAVQSSDTPSNGQFPRWNTGGTTTWETPTATGDGSALTNLNASSIASGTISSNRLPSDIALTSLSAGTLTATSVAGDGSGLTNLNAANLTGTISDARIAATIARTNAPTLHSPTLLTPSLGVASATSLTTGPLLVTSDFVQNSASIASALGAELVLDFKWPVSTFAATNNVVVLQSTNRPSAATNVVFSMLRITGDTVDRTISYPASWKRLGTNITTIPSNKVVLVSGMCIGTAESGVTFGVAKEE
ncbi:MAG: SGNH/GDSL hydrolase family protein [Chromatiaceae bacterium]